MLPLPPFYSSPPVRMKSRPIGALLPTLAHVASLAHNRNRNEGCGTTMCLKAGARDTIAYQALPQHASHTLHR